MSDELILRLATGARVPVRVEPMLPYESTDPERPGMVHSIMWDGVLYLSPEAYEQLKVLPEKKP